MPVQSAAIKSASSAPGNLPEWREKFTRKKLTEEEVDDLRPEYDLETLLPNGVQGKYASRFREGTNIVLLDGDVAAAFPNDEAVNEALRLVIKLSEVPYKQKKGASKPSTP